MNIIPGKLDWGKELIGRRRQVSIPYSGEMISFLATISYIKIIRMKAQAMVRQKPPSYQRRTTAAGPD